MSTVPYFSYARDNQGCDELWSIYAPHQTRPFAYIPFWDDQYTHEKKAPKPKLAVWCSL